MKKYSVDDVEFKMDEFNTKFFISVDGLDESDCPFFVVNILWPGRSELKAPLFRANFCIEGVEHFTRGELSESMFGSCYKDLSGKDKVSVDENFDKTVDKKVGLLKLLLVNKVNEIMEVHFGKLN